MQKNDYDITRAYIQKIANHPILTKEEEEKVAKNLASKNKRRREAAIEHLVTHNLKLVVHIAGDYSHAGNIDDIISEGNIGLMRAAETYELGHNSRFSSYASWWIHQRIRRHLGNTSNTVRLPIHILGKLTALTRIRTQLAAELGRNPTAEEISETTGIPTEKIERLERLQGRTISLDAPTSNQPDDDTRLGDTIPDNAPTPDLHAQQNLETARLQNLLNLLPTKTKEILERRFGINGYHSQTLEEIGRVFHVTRERIRQLEAAGLRKLRYLYNKKSLHEILNDATGPRSRNGAQGKPHPNQTPQARQKPIGKTPPKTKGTHAPKKTPHPKVRPTGVRVIEKAVPKRGAKKGAKGKARTQPNPKPKTKTRTRVKTKKQPKPEKGKSQKREACLTKPKETKRTATKKKRQTLDRRSKTKDGKQVLRTPRPQTRAARLSKRHLDDRRKKSPRPRRKNPRRR